MGEHFSGVTDGTLYYVPKNEFERIRQLNMSSDERVQLFAMAARINTLYMIARAGSGHIGSSFSSIDIVSQLYLETLADGDVYFSSKGHDAPGLYGVLTAIGTLPFEKIHSLRRLGGLPGHPDVSLPGMVTNTGSLGMGISKAKGMIFADRLAGRRRRYVVMTGDGELQEGQIWESLPSAVNHKLSELMVIVDHNKLQSDTYLSSVSDLGDIVAKFRAFGWRAACCNGHDVKELSTVFADFSKETDRPQVVIANTIKGCGVSFMEHTAIPAGQQLYKYHSGAPPTEDYGRALDELVDVTTQQLDRIGAAALKLESEKSVHLAPSDTVKKIIPAYTDALIALAEKHRNIVALDADLVLDTGLIPYRERFPNRFLECGISEQDMVSQAGGMALSGLLPIAHSFACFLTSRANEQIYNNATERRKAIYVGSLAGLLPGGPGHSHQGVRDISVMASIPGMTIIEPSCPEEVEPLLRWAVEKASGPVYMRLCSIPWEIPYTVDARDALTPGCGRVFREGKDVVLLSHGPVMLSQAWHAAMSLSEKDVEATVVNMPWLNMIDNDWFSDIVGGAKLVVAIDDNYSVGGQADRIGVALAECCDKSKPKFLRISLSDIPVCGTNTEVLNYHGFDEDSIVKSVLYTLPSL